MKNNTHCHASQLALLATALVVLGSSLQAQTLIASLPSESGARSSSVITGTFTGKAKLKADSAGFGEVSSKDFGASFHETLPLSDYSDIGAGMTYGRTSFDFANTGPTSPVPTKLQNLSLDLSYAQRFNDSWSGTLAVSPGYRSTGRAFSSKSFVRPPRPSRSIVSIPRCRSPRGLVSTRRPPAINSAVRSPSIGIPATPGA